MGPFRKMVWTITLLFFLAGCSTYQMGVLPEYPDSDGQVEGKKAPVVVHVGSDVKLSLSDGRVVKGRVSQVSAEAVVLGKVGNYGWEEKVFPREQIAKLEVQHPNSLVGGILTGLAVTSLVLVVLVASLSTRISEVLLD